MVDAALPVAAGRARARAGRRALMAGAAGGACVVLVVVFAVAGGAGWRTVVDAYTLTNTVIGLGFLAPGAVIVRFRPANAVGGLLLWAGLGHLATAAATMLGFFALAGDWPTPVLRALSTVATGAWQLGIPLLFPLALLLFPDGRLPSPRWRPVAWLVVLGGSYQLVSGVLSDGSILGDPARTASILSVGLAVPAAVTTVAGLAVAGGFLLVVAALVTRYARGDERTRRQLLWLILAMLGILALNLQRWATGDGPILLLLSAALVPIAIGIAILRHELLDIRVVLSRTLLYGVALSVVVAVYAGLVAGFSLLVPARAERGVAVAAAIVVALIFTPVRLVLLRGLDRAFFGTRSDPAATAGRIGRELRHADDLDGVLERTCEALRLPWLAVRREPDGAQLAAAGTPTGAPPVELPLRYRGERVGTLLVALRRGERGLHEADRRTLDLVATPLAVALHATELREQVQQARTATVEAGAAERVRLQRELHDGLGPALTSVTFQADAASNLLRADADAAEQVLREVRAGLRGALGDLRRVVYGLRPIELDDLGLLGALRERVVALRGDAGRALAVELDLPAALPALSPAVELAAYRVVTEALANVVRHSSARRCVVAVGVAVDGGLVVTVTDDGAPPAPWRPGVGLRSIADRAEELGGAATAGPAAAGWAVAVRLPLRAGRPGG